MIRTPRALVAFSVPAACLLGHAQSHTLNEHSSCAQYLGNAGILVATKDVKIMFDAFFNDSYGGRFTLVPPEIEEPLFRGAPPYDNVDAIFVSHAHGDHFSPEPTIRYMRAHRDVLLFATRQTVDALKNGGADDQLIDRITAFDLVPGESHPPLHVKGISIEVTAIQHNGGEQMADVQNLAFRVALTPETIVMHLGDSTPDLELFQRYHDLWKRTPVAYAFAPYWFVTSEPGRRILDKLVAAQSTNAIHFPSQASDQREAFEEEYKTHVLTLPGEVVVVGADTPDPCQGDH
ncbi:MAG: hypothetical protein DHS20C04_06080 [Hyphococcus sp.]|nr:MAG: hypothetical protein DHS20C04_06080 [Marinicaulis sp.]